jgi:single-strand DNA-binding protein
MASINTFIFDGNLVRDPELRYTPKGAPVARYTVAVDHAFRVGNELRAETDFIPVTVYGAQAERDAKFLHKGHRVTVQARVHSWFDAAKQKGGFNFVAEVVKYQRRPGGGADSIPVAPAPTCDDDWLRDYDRAEAALEGAAPATPIRRSGHPGQARAREGPIPAAPNTPG